MTAVEIHNNSKPDELNEFECGEWEGCEGCEGCESSESYEGSERKLNNVENI